ncbi:hypothetical protein AMTRI_Chr10g231010 [Amborella trichopoda]
MIPSCTVIFLKLRNCLFLDFIVTKFWQYPHNHSQFSVSISEKLRISAKTLKVEIRFQSYREKI